MLIETPNVNSQQQVPFMPIIYTDNGKPLSIENYRLINKRPVDVEEDNILM